MPKIVKEGVKGQVCAICGETKTPYEFTSFRSLDDTDRAFFVYARKDARGNFRNDVCWTCNAPYRCLGCGNVLPSSEFRVQGRYCRYCKSSWNTPANMRRKSA